MDGRLYKQAERMGEQFPNPIIILEGGPEYGRSKRRSNYTAQLSRGAVNSAALRCVVDYGVSILPSLSAADTARIIIKGVEQLGKPKKILRTNTKKKGKTIKEKRQNVIEAFPGIGPKLATNINSKPFPLIAILKAIDNCQIEGLGPKKIKAIQEVLNNVDV